MLMGMIDVTVPSHSRRDVKAVLFDLDDTLIDRAGGYARLCRHWYRTLPSRGRPADEEQFVARMAEWDQSGAAKHERYGRLLRLWPASFRDVESAIAAHRRSLADFVTVDPRTRALLIRLRRAGIRTAVVSNGRAASQRRKLRNTGIDEVVDEIVVSAEVGAAKPATGIFRHALNAIGADPAEALFVGDNPVADIRGAKRFGMRAVWVHLGREWGIAVPRPDYVVGAVWEIGREAWARSGHSHG